ncbi:MAG: hypothetical protein CMM93_04210 [Rickettsiales bacterium]|nr:hypothetical protein [Rickettsiales bacterium]|tara:strand:- start:2946 stop:3146 length:201 start_codon:yes stop_codon:yes gene_type:complete
MDYFKLLLCDHIAKKKVPTKMDDFGGFVFENTITQKIIGGRKKESLPNIISEKDYETEVFSGVVIL